MPNQQTPLMSSSASSGFGPIVAGPTHKPWWSTAAQAFQAVLMFVGIVSTQVESDSALVQGANDHLSSFSEWLPEITVWAGVLAVQSLSNVSAAAFCTIPTGAHAGEASRADISQLVCCLIAVGALIDFGANPAHRHWVQGCLADNRDMPLSAAIVMLTQSLVNILTVFEPRADMSCASAFVRGAIRALGFEGATRAGRKVFLKLFSSCARREVAEPGYSSVEVTATINNNS